MSLRDALLGSDASSRTRLAALVLAVVITVALAATAAVYVLDAEDDGPVTAAVNTTVDDRNRTVTFTVEEIGDAESFVLRGEGIDGSEVLLGALDDSGDSMTLDADETLADEGDVSVIMNDGDSEYAVSTAVWNWSDDTDDETNATVNAAVSTSVDADSRELTVTVDEVGTAESFVLRGDGVEGDEFDLNLENTGDATTVAAGDELSTDPGPVRVVAIAGDAERVLTTVGNDSSDGGTVNAAVSTDVDDDARAVTLAVTDVGAADAFVLRGDGVAGNEIELDLEATGDTTTVSADDGLAPDRGVANIVAIDGERESAIGQFEWDWTTDDGSPTESQ